MKKFRKIILIISGILAVVGILFVIIGVSAGGTYTAAKDILDGNLSVSWDDEKWKDDDIENMNPVTDDGNIFSKDEINSIILNGKYGEFEIHVWENDTYAIQVTEGTDRIKYSIADETLKISMTEKDWMFWEDSVKVKIYIPKDKVLDSAELNVGAGTLACNYLKTQTLQVKIGAGEGEFYQVEAVDSTFEVGAGEGSIENASLAECKMKVGMGEMNMEGTITGNVDVDCGMGSVEMELSNMYTDFNYTVNVGAGEVQLGGQEYSGISHNVNQNNNADKAMNIKCGMGEVSVEFFQ